MTETFRLELANCQQYILEEIADPRFKQTDVAFTYALCMRSSEGETMDWGIVNQAIEKRWSRGGLSRIKKMAWGRR